MFLGRSIITSEVSQFKRKVDRYFIGMARSHTNHDKLRIGIVQVKKRKLSKNFRGPPIGDGVLLRNFTENGRCGAGCSLLNVFVKCLNHLW